MKPPIKDTPKEDKPPNKGQAESTHVYTIYRKSPLKEDNLSTKDKTAGPEGVLIKRFHCRWACAFFKQLYSSITNIILLNEFKTCYLDVFFLSVFAGAISLALSGSHQSEIPLHQVLHLAFLLHNILQGHSEQDR